MEKGLKIAFIERIMLVILSLPTRYIVNNQTDFKNYFKIFLVTTS